MGSGLIYDSGSDDNESLMDGEGESLLATIQSSNTHNELSQRTGTIWSATAHIITGVIGAGILSLAWSTAQLGWILGPLAMTIFVAITFVSTFLLCDCYRSPDPEFGPTRNRSFMEAVKFYLGEKSQRICGIFILESLYGAGVAYTITAASSIGSIQISNCYHREGHKADCEYGNNIPMLPFGIVQIIISQIPDFHNMAWLSVIAAIMSLTYACIGLALSLAKVIENGYILGSIEGVPANTAVQKLCSAFQALGDMAFAYSYTIILLEIQDTLKSPPPENQTMKKSSVAAILITTFFYLCCGCFGYAAFGNNTPGNLLTGFAFDEQYWLVDFANACIVLHLVGGYQIFSQPLFALAEKWSTEKFPNNGFVNNFYGFKLPLLPAIQLNLFRLSFRTGYVVSTTGLAMIFPYFNQVLGVLGALNFWPMAFYFPIEMYIVQRNIEAWTRKWVILQAFSAVCSLAAIVGLLGSVGGLFIAKFS